MTCKSPPFKPATYFYNMACSATVLPALTLGFFLSFGIWPAVSMAQSEGISPTYTFSIRKKVEPPIIDIVPGSLLFEDVDGNNAINANEACAIVFELKNTGTGDGLNLKAKLGVTGSTTGVTAAPLQPIDNLPKSGTRAYRLPVMGGMVTADGEVEFTLEVEEPNGFNTIPVTLVVATRKFAAPMVQVVDHTIVSTDGASTLALRKPFTLQVLVQNTGQGSANDVRYTFAHPMDVFMTVGEASATLGTLLPGETRSLEFELIMNARYMGTQLDLQLALSEGYGKYAKDWKGIFTLNQALASQRLVVQSRPQDVHTVEVASLRSDVDKDIPLGIPINPKKYALIIGNEDYSKYQPGLEREVNVDYAANDARVFAEYAERTLGVPKQNITLLIDATKGQMSQAIAKHERLLQVERGDAEIIFYYSGHGLPEESTNTPYLIPVDVNGMQPSNGIALQDIYASLNRHPTRKALVVLDACFSGGARSKELAAMKGVRVNANVSNVPASLVVLASSSGTEASAVYRDKQHGYFTYFLLKELKAGGWQSPLKPVMDAVQQNVARETARIGKLQTPVMLVGQGMDGTTEEFAW